MMIIMIIVEMPFTKECIRIVKLLDWTYVWGYLNYNLTIEASASSDVSGKRFILKLVFLCNYIPINKLSRHSSFVVSYENVKNE